MVCHKCPNCDMEFNKKSNYLQHTNKKFKCIKKVYLTCVECNEDDNIEQKIQNNPKKSKKIQKIQSNLLEQIQLDNKKETDTITDANTDTDTDTNTDKDADNFNDEKCICCPYCSKCYSTKSNLSKHLKTNCKIKKQQEEEKENIFKLLLSKDDVIKEQKEIINKILEQNQTLIKEITDLKKIKIKTNKSIGNVNLTNLSNTNNTTINANTNTTNNNIVIVNFGKENLNLIDKQIYLDRVVKKAISGVRIPEEVLKIIHFNPKYPQLSNIYISDINREKCMIWEDGGWKLSPTDKIPQVIEKVVNYSNGVESELRQQYLNNKKINDRLDVVSKYIGMNGNEYIDELKEDFESNANLIKRCEDFQQLTYNTFKTTLYNEGKNIKKQKINVDFSC